MESELEEANAIATASNHKFEDVRPGYLIKIILKRALRDTKNKQLKIITLGVSFLTVLFEISIKKWHTWCILKNLP